MPILHHVRQGSEAWDKLRLGIPTSSVFDRVWTPPSEKYKLGQESKQWENLAFTLLAERFLGYKMAEYVSPHMEDGKEFEEEAADWYELTTHRHPVLIGFITNDAKTMGCSPDRLIGDDGLLEIKAPKGNTQMKYLIKGTIADDYWPQLQGQLYISDRQWVDIVAYHRLIPRTIIRVERDEPYIAKLAAELDKLVEYIERCWEKIQEMAGKPSNGQRQGDLARLKASLQASLAREDKARSGGSVEAQEAKAVVGSIEREARAGPRAAGASGDVAPGPLSPRHPELTRGRVVVIERTGGYDPARGREQLADFPPLQGPRAEVGPGETSAPLRSEPADVTPQPGIGGGGSSETMSTDGPPSKVWRCECGEEFEIYGAFSRHRQRTGHKVPTEQRAAALRPGRSSSGQDTGIATELQPAKPETRVRVPPDSIPAAPPDMLSRLNPIEPAEETFWDIAARTGDYHVPVLDKNIATIGRDTLMNLVAVAPTVEALTAFYQGNHVTLETMGKVRGASRNEVVKAMTRRKKELEGE